MHMDNIYIAHGSYVVICTHALPIHGMCMQYSVCVCVCVCAVHCFECAVCPLHMCIICVHICIRGHVCVFTFSLSASHRFLFSPQSAAECSSLLRTLHGLEQEDLQRSLTLQQAEDFAQAHRQLAVFQRNELHSIVYTQIQSAVAKGELRPEVAKMLLQDYSKTQVTSAFRLSPAQRCFLKPR